MSGKEDTLPPEGIQGPGASFTRDQDASSVSGDATLPQGQQPDFQARHRQDFLEYVEHAKVTIF